jgi:predicted nucleotidyltransferase
MRTDSDVDLLIEFEPGYSPSLAGFARLKQELEATLAVASIDFATRAILRNPNRRQAMRNSKLRSSLTPQTSAG